jgi:adenylate cyclase
MDLSPPRLIFATRCLQSGIERVAFSNAAEHDCGKRITPLRIRNQLHVRTASHPSLKRIRYYVRKVITAGAGMTTEPDFDADLRIETTTIMFADVVESVRLIEEDEIGNIVRVRELLRSLVSEVVPHYFGTTLECRGDGLLIKFASAKHASGCALALHEATIAFNASAAAEAIFLRIGIHTAEVFTDEVSLFGRGVNMAARVASLASPGETIATAKTRDQLVATVDADIEDMGECYLKHLSAPVRAYRLVRSDQATPMTPAQATELRPTLAIIPPRMISGDAEHTMHADVFADCVIAALSKTPELRIMSRLSTRAFQNREFSASDLRQRLGADYVLSGTARFTADRVSLQLELCSLGDSEVVWAQQIKGDTSALLDADGEVVGTVTTQVADAVLKAQIGAVVAAKLPTLKSYSLLLAGIGLLHRQQFSEFNRARQLFEVLSERHPRHATPYAWQAAWRVFRVTQGWFDDLARETSIASDLARRAVDADGTNSLSHTVQGLVSTNLRRDFDAARGSFELALAHNKSEPLAWLHRGTLKAFVGNGADALEDTVQARRLSPLDPWSYYFETLSASAAFAAGEYAEAVRLARSSMRANRLHLSTLRVLAMAHAELGFLDDARRYLNQVLEIEPTLTVSKYLARSPSSGRHMAEVCARALRKAGLTE